MLITAGLQMILTSAPVQKLGNPISWMLRGLASSISAFADTTTHCVRRITEADGATTVEFTIGNWENRANLTYQPVNTTLEISE